jgi:hypothetical protein
MFNHPALESSS